MCKKIDIKLYEELRSQGTHCLYTEVDKVHKVEKVKENNLTIISKSHAHPHTMMKTLAKFKKDWYKRSCAHKTPRINVDGRMNGRTNGRKLARLGRPC